MSFGFEESVGDLTTNRDLAKTPEMWITNTTPGRHSTMMEFASATPLIESKFSVEQTTITTSSLNTMGTKRKHESADDDKMQADSLKQRDPGSWTVREWERAANSTTNTSRSARAGVPDEIAQEFPVTSNGNLQNEISDPDEYANAANATGM